MSGEGEGGARGRGRIYSQGGSSSSSSGGGTRGKGGGKKKIRQIAQGPRSAATAAAAAATAAAAAATACAAAASGALTLIRAVSGPSLVEERRNISPQKPRPAGLYHILRRRAVAINKTERARAGISARAAWFSSATG